MAQTDKIAVISFITYNVNTKKHTLIFTWKDQLSAIDCDTAEEALAIQTQVLAEINVESRMLN